MIVGLAVVAGGLGALARVGVSGHVQRALRTTRPWGTATVNVVGALALGVLVGLHDSAGFSDDALHVVGVGFLGGFTTFSTWMVESVKLIDSAGGAGTRAAFLNVVGLLVVGVGAAATGVLVGHRL